MSENPSQKSAPKVPLPNDAEISAMMRAQMDIPGLDIADILQKASPDQKRDLSQWALQMEKMNIQIETRLQQEQIRKGISPAQRAKQIGTQNVAFIPNAALSPETLNKMRDTRRDILIKIFEMLAKDSEKMREVSVPERNQAELEDSNKKSIVEILDELEEGILYGDIPDDPKDRSIRNKYFYKGDVLLPRFGIIYTEALPKIEDAMKSIKILQDQPLPADEKAYYASLHQRAENLLKSIKAMESMDPAKAIVAKIRIQAQHGKLSMDEKIMKGSAIAVATVFSVLSAVPAIMKMIRGKEVSEEEIFGSVAYTGILGYLTKMLPGMNMDKNQAQTLSRVSTLALRKPFQDALKNIKEKPAQDAADEFHENYIAAKDNDSRKRKKLLEDRLENNLPLNDDFLNEFTENQKEESKIYTALINISEKDRKEFLGSILLSRTEEKGTIDAFKSAISVAIHSTSIGIGRSNVA